MKGLVTFAVLIILITFVTSCNQSDSGSVKDEKIATIATIEFEKVSHDVPNPEEVTLDLKKGQKLEFWTELDISYKGYLDLTYVIELWQQETFIGGFELNALQTSPTLDSKKISNGDNTNWSFKGKMDFLEVEKSGNYTFKAILYSSDPNLDFRRAKLIFKRQ